MSPVEPLAHVLDALDHNSIPYMVAGSVAGNVYGVPRTTLDADVVIQPDIKSLRRFIDFLGEEFHADIIPALDALRHQGMFNVIHLATGFKVDFVVCKSRPFSKEEFQRRKNLPFTGKGRWFASPEDVILSKLEWGNAGGSERQFQDALNVAKSQNDNLDWIYMKRWAGELNIEDLLERVRTLVDPT
ncbi:MAG: hypothetical protein ACKVRP_13375 [Bacteroidota bacterium]